MPITNRSHGCRARQTATRAARRSTAARVRSSRLDPYGLRGMPHDTRSLRTDARTQSPPLPHELTRGIIRRAFRGDPELYHRFLGTLRESIGHADIVLRGSAVTGESYRGHDAFDADGPGTSDLDIVLIGRDALQLWLPDAFYVRWVNTIPLSDRTRWVAPGLDPAREAAQSLVGRPVNIQASRDIVIQFRGDLLGQPYLTLFEKPAGISITDSHPA